MRSLPLAVLLLAAGCGPDPARDDAAYDAAALRLAARIEGEPRNRDFAAALAARLAAVRRAPEAAAQELGRRIEALGLAPLRVPGLFYRSHPETGADLSGLERALAIAMPLVETGERATVEDNAALVAGAVRGAARGGRRVLLVSASKGSADVRAALEAEPSLGRDVALWLDLVGVLEGTPLTDPGRPWSDEVRAWLPEATARSLSHAERAAAAAAERFPRETLAVHVAAFPLSAEVSARARPGFERLRPLGPNDGYVLLDAYLRAPGRVAIVRGTDHYLRRDDLADRLAAILLVLCDELARAPGA